MFVNFNILNQLGSPAINSNTFANRPAAGQTGRLFVSTDTFELYRDNGTTYDLIGGPGSSTITGSGTATQVAFFSSTSALTSSANLFFDNTNNRLGVNTATPTVALDVVGKSLFTQTETYSTGVVRTNFLDANITVAAGGSFSSPNAITALGATLDLTLQGSATIPSGARSGLDAYNSVSFTGTGTLTHTQGTQIRAYSNLTTGWAFAGSATGTITHLAGLRVLFPDNTGSAVTITNNYALLLNDQTANTGTVTYTNRWGVYQEGASDLNYMAANLLLGSTTNNGNKLQVTGNGNLTGDMTADAYYLNGMTAGNGALYWTSDRVTVANYNANGIVHIETNGGTFAAIFDASGNFGLGVTPSAWDSPDFRALQVGSGMALFGRSTGDADRGGITANAYNDGTWKYIATGNATRAEQTDGIHAFFTAPSGTADNAISFTQAMTLDASGNLGIGTTSPSTRLHIVSGQSSIPDLYIQGAGSSQGWLGFGTTNDYGIQGGADYLAINFRLNGSERMRITSGGNVLIGTTTDAGQKLQVNGNSYINGSTGTTALNMNNMTSLGSIGSGNIYMPYTAGIAFRSADGSTGYGSITGDTNSNIIFSSAIKTAAPSGGTAKPWKFGNVASVTPTAQNRTIELEVDGTTYYLTAKTTND